VQRFPMSPAVSATAQAILTVRQHSRQCQSIETRQLLLAVERHLLKIYDAESSFCMCRSTALAITLAVR